MNLKDLANAVKYDRNNPPPSLERAEERATELTNIIILCGTESRNARSADFDNREALQQYLAERTSAIVACKIERTFLNGFLARTRYENEQSQRQSERREDRLTLAPGVAHDIDEISLRADELIHKGFPAGIRADSSEEAATRRGALIGMKNEILSLFTALKQIREMHGSIPFPQKSQLKDMLYQIEKEFRTIRRIRAGEHYAQRCEKHGRPQLDISLRDAICFLLNLVEEHPPDLSADVMAQQTLEKIQQWAAD